MRIYYELVYMTVLAARNEHCLAVKSSGMIFRLSVQFYNLSMQPKREKSASAH